MGKEELIRYFEDAIALETEIVTQKNLVSQFEAMSENKKPVLVERKVQVERPAPDALESEENHVIGSIVIWTILCLVAAISLRDLGVFWIVVCLTIMTVGDAIPLAIYLPEKKEWEEKYSEQMKNIMKITRCVWKKIKPEKRNLSITRSAGRILAQK